MSREVSSLKRFFNENPRQKWLLIGYCSFIALFFFLRVARNNQEFLFFSGVLAALYYFYNNELFTYKLLKYVYLLIDIILCVSFIILKKETISMLFPITTYFYLFTGRILFYQISKSEPHIDILLSKGSNRFYTLLMFLLIVVTWIAIVIKFMDNKIV